MVAVDRSFMLRRKFRAWGKDRIILCLRSVRNKNVSGKGIDLVIAMGLLFKPFFRRFKRLAHHRLNLLGIGLLASHQIAEVHASPFP